MSRTVILRDKAGAGGIECAHHIKDEAVGIGIRRISLYIDISGSIRIKSDGMTYYADVNPAA